MNTLSGQIAVTGACNRNHKAEQRLARWLLTARDRVSSDSMALTHGEMNPTDAGSLAQTQPGYLMQIELASAAERLNSLGDLPRREVPGDLSQFFVSPAQPASLQVIHDPGYPVVLRRR